MHKAFAATAMTIPKKTNILLLTFWIIHAVKIEPAARPPKSIPATLPTQKAFEQGLNPIVVINKIDRPEARPFWVLDQVFELFDRLGASDDQLDFPVIYASALQGISSLDPDQMEDNMDSLLDIIINLNSLQSLGMLSNLRLRSNFMTGFMKA